MDKRQMRITWNENNWEKPSGHLWKKENQGKKNVPYENQYGFGHEEWLFNPRYRLNGFQYGYVRGVEKASLKDDIIDELYLYTKDSLTNYFIVGILKNVIRIKDDQKEQQFVYKLYQNYSNNAIEELQEVNAVHTEIINTGLMPTLKFKWKDAIIFEEPLPYSIDDSKYRRYQPFRLTSELERFAEIQIAENNKLEFVSGKTNKKSSYTISKTQGKREVYSLHVEILDDLYKHLLKQNNKNNISAEKSTINGKIIDLLEKIEANKFNFYEVKTSYSGLTNIREAIGQILEYALLDNSITPNKLIIIGPADLGTNEYTYLKSLQKIISISIEYWYFKIEEKVFKIIK